MILLEGIKVLDLSQYALGHYCTMVLGELGAEIIKVEQPPRPGLTGFRTSFEREFVLNHNKKSIGLNLKKDEGKEVFYRLTQKANAIFEGFRPGVVKRLGVDYETVRKVNPRIVYCSLTGYGQYGPYRDLVGHDINYVAMGGVLSLLEGMPPLDLVGDRAGGSQFSLIGILAALLACERTGMGQYVDVAMLDGVISLASWLTRISERELTEYKGSTSHYNIYKTKDDKYISIGCIEPRFWENLCRALNRDDFISHQHDENKRTEILSTFQEIFCTKSRDEWFELLRQRDLCVAPVYTLDEMLSDAHVISRGMVIDVEHPALGTVKQIGPALKFSDASAPTWQPPPQPGEHTNEILTELGYTSDEISQLRQIGAVR